MYQNNIQAKIDKAIANKEKRYNKTELSINVSWAINNAVNFLPEKLKGTEEGLALVRKYYPVFIEEYRSWMLENLPDPLDKTPTEKSAAKKDKLEFDQRIDELNTLNEEEAVNTEFQEATQKEEKIPVIKE